MATFREFKVAALLLSAGMMSARPQDISGAVQGSVKHLVTLAGISGARVEVCPSSDGSTATFESIQMPPREQVGEIRLDTRSIEINDRTGAILVSATDCPMPLTATTDDEGQFTIRGLKTGQYIVRARREGYASPTPMRDADTVTSPVTLTPERPKLVLQPLHMVRAATISGIVLDARGRPMPTVNVSAVVEQTGEAGSASSPISARQTNDRGEYRLLGLPPGRYFIVARPPIGDFISRQIGTAVFYPSAFNLPDAIPIVVKEGEDVGAINITWRPQPR